MPLCRHPKSRLPPILSSDSFYDEKPLCTGDDLVDPDIFVRHRYVQVRSPSSRHAGPSSARDDALELSQWFRSHRTIQMVQASIDPFRFAMLEVLGRGERSVVFKALHIPSGITVAIKSLHLPNKDTAKQLFYSVIEQVAAAGVQAQSFHHVGLVDVAKGSKLRVHVILEYMDAGDLGSMVRTRRAQTGGGVTNEAELYNIASQLLVALDHARAARSSPAATCLTPSKVLLGSDGRVTLGRRGMTPEVAESIAMCSRLDLSDAFQHARYDAPEVVQGSTEGGEAGAAQALVWSYGLVLLECIMGAYPYEHALHYFQFLSILTNDDVPGISPDAPVSDDCRHFIGRCLVKRRCDRATLEELRDHPWMRAHWLWSPASHAFFPRFAREHAVRLLLLSHSLAHAVGARTGAAAAALPDIFLEHVIPRAVQRIDFDFRTTAL